MPCILKAVHSSTHYRRIPQRTRSMAENPGIVVESPADAAMIAMMVIFFALLGMVIVLIAVFCSKRSLEKECKRSDTLQLAPVPARGSAAGTASPSWTGRSSRARPSVFESGNELPRFQSLRASGQTTIRERRGLVELSLKDLSPGKDGLPQPPAHFHQPAVGSVVFPGVKYGMWQVGNDGKVHRPVGIFEYLRP